MFDRSSRPAGARPFAGLMVLVALAAGPVVAAPFEKLRAPGRAPPDSTTADSDGDGIVNAKDLAPYEAEDMDGADDGDGAPDTLGVPVPVPPEPPARPAKAPVVKPTRAGPPPDAKLAFIRPQVEVQPRGLPDWKTATPGHELFRLDSVTTRAGAGAELRFVDESFLRMLENALVVVYGKGATPAAEVKAKSGAVQLVQGDLRLGLARLRGERLTVVTDSADVSAASRDFSVGVDEKKAARVSVFDGEATVTAGGKVVAVPAGFGTRVEAGKAPEPAQALPGPPVWLTREQILVTLDPGPGAAVDLSWNKQPEAASWRLELAGDLQFGRIAAVEAVTKTAFSGPSKGLPPGRRAFARLVPVAPSGVWGNASNVLPIEVVAVSGSRGHWDAPRSRWVATESTTLKLKGPGPLAVELDKAPAPASPVIATLGPHVVTVSARDVDSTPATLAVEIVPPALALTIDKAGDAFDATLLFTDTEGQPFDVDATALAFRLPAGAKAGAVRRESPGRYVLPITAATAPTMECLYRGQPVVPTAR